MEDNPEQQPKFRRNPNEKIKRIKDVFVRLVETNGYDNVTTNHIAKEAGLSIGTVYKYFKGGKSEILKAVFDEEIDSFMDEEDFPKFLQMIAKIDPEGIRQFVTKYYEGHKEYYVYHMAYDHAIATDKELFKTFQNEIKYTIRDVIPYAKKLPELANVDDEVIFQTIFIATNTVESLVHQQLFYAPFFDEDEEFIDYLAKLFEFILRTYLR